MEYFAALILLITLIGFLAMPIYVVIRVLTKPLYEDTDEVQTLEVE